VCAPWVTRHTSGHLKTEHTESLFLLATPSWKLAPRTVAAADGVGCAHVM